LKSVWEREMELEREWIKRREEERENVKVEEICLLTEEPCKPIEACKKYMTKNGCPFQQVIYYLKIRKTE